MEANHTNQIRVFLEKTDTLLDIKYDNSKGVTHAIKTSEAKMFKKIPKIERRLIFFHNFTPKYSYLLK